MRHILLGIFPKHKNADKTLVELVDAGFIRDEISVIANDEILNSRGEIIAAGGALGGLAGALTAATPIFLPGVGLLVAGPLLALTGLVIGATAGGLLGALVEAGISRSQAQSYARRIQEGEVLIGVPVDDTSEIKAWEIMEKYEAEELVLILYPGQQKQASETESTGSFQGAKGGKSTKQK